MLTISHARSLSMTFTSRFKPEISARPARIVARAHQAVLRVFFKVHDFDNSRLMHSRTTPLYAITSPASTFSLASKSSFLLLLFNSRYGASPKLQTRSPALGSL